MFFIREERTRNSLALIFILSVVLIFPSKSYAFHVDLIPQDEETISTNNWNTGNVDYLWTRKTSETYWEDIFIKFDFSAIPDGSVIDSMRFSAKSYRSTGGNIGLYEVNSNNWSGSTADDYPGIGSLIAPHQVINTTFTWYYWDFDIGARDWNTDLANNALSISMHNSLISMDETDFLRDGMVLGVNYTESSAVPEPATMVLIALGLAGIGLTRKKR